MSEVRQQMTYTEFLDWLTFLSMEEERHTKQEFYLAQIAAEVRRGHVKHPAKVKMTDFLMKSKAAPSTSVRPNSKSIWASHLGIKLKGKK